MIIEIGDIVSDADELVRRLNDGERRDYAEHRRVWKVIRNQWQARNPFAFSEYYGKAALAPCGQPPQN